MEQSSEEGRPERLQAAGLLSGPEVQFLPSDARMMDKGPPNPMRSSYRPLAYSIDRKEVVDALCGAHQRGVPLVDRQSTPEEQGKLVLQLQLKSSG